MRDGLRVLAVIVPIWILMFVTVVLIVMYAEPACG
ncbi:hypothetical protein SEA_REDWATTLEHOG_108 [Gordonia phage RedWattleHog]|uniref:Uncharacterized protein n=1 Tax=Gordonia phage Stormageddon TaxID=2656541 RepID=A0A649VR36_9CAUD|nr:hypothetical protein KHQ86_gp193 [Gordonia phage Stormageddon]QGJ94967.1 hypothetical protein SEA_STORMAGEDDON_107 [Gordonia phage Stormageddon]QLF83611.1 hypothetical protein SEA_REDWATTLEHOG_108 [Gordonia phage RedWattleHog]